MSIREERKQQSRQALLNAALQLSTSGRSFARISLLLHCSLCVVKCTSVFIHVICV